MLEIVIGGVVEGRAERRYTICPADRTTGVGFELTPEGQLVFTAVFHRYNNPIPFPRHTSELAQCSAPLCLLFRFADFSELEEEPGQYQLKMALADPVALTIGLVFLISSAVGKVAFMRCPEIFPECRVLRFPDPENFRIRKAKSPAFRTKFRKGGFVAGKKGGVRLSPNAPP